MIFRILKNHCKDIDGTPKDFNHNLTSSEIQFFPLTKVETLITFGQCEYKHFNTTKMYLHVGWTIPQKYDDSFCNFDINQFRVWNLLWACPLNIVVNSSRFVTFQIRLKLNDRLFCILRQSILRFFDHSLQ